VPRQLWPAYRIDAAVHDVQPTRVELMDDGVSGEPKGQKLLTRDNLMLPACQSRQPLLTLYGHNR